MMTLSSTNDDDDDDDKDDYDCESGWKQITKKYKVDYITNNRMSSNFFVHRLDGRRHPAIPTSAHCQYCYYIYKYELNDDKKAVSDIMTQNRKDVHLCLTCNVNLCLTCNVNLCVKCEMEFHGIKLDNLKGIVPGEYQSK